MHFEIAHDLRQVKATVRFSTVGGENGSAHTARDPRGFAIKLKADEGNRVWSIH